MGMSDDENDSEDFEKYYGERQIDTSMYEDPIAPLTRDDSGSQIDINMEPGKVISFGISLLVVYAISLAFIVCGILDLTQNHDVTSFAVCTAIGVCIAAVAIYRNW